MATKLTASIFSIEAKTSKAGNKYFLLKFHSKQTNDVLQFCLLVEKPSTRQLMTSIFGFVRKNLNSLWCQVNENEDYAKMLTSVFAENPYQICFENDFLTSVEKLRKRHILEFEATSIVIKNPKIRIVL